MILETSQTALNLAKNVEQIGPFCGMKPPIGSQHQILHDIFIGESTQKRNNSSLAKLQNLQYHSNFDYRHLSNFMYARSLVKCVLNVEKGHTLFGM